MRSNQAQRIYAHIQHHETGVQRSVILDILSLERVPDGTVVRLIATGQMAEVVGYNGGDYYRLYVGKRSGVILAHRSDFVGGGQ